MLTRLIMLITWQYTQIQSHYVVHLKLKCYMSVIAHKKKKTGKKSLF